MTDPEITIVGDDRLSDSAIAALAALLLAVSEERGADDLPHLHRDQEARALIGFIRKEVAITR